MSTVKLNRRDFLKSTATLTSGLILGFYLPPAESVRLAQAEETSAPLMNAWLRISADDTVTVLIAHSEMGQGVYTSLPMLVAEELEVSWEKIAIEQSPTNQTYINPIIGAQITGGSTTIRGRWQGLRIAGAQAKEMLIEAAAEQWQVKVADCEAINGQVIHKSSGKKLNYGQLAEAAAKLIPPEFPKLKEPSAFKIIGKSIKRLDTPAKVAGTAVFGIDVKVPDMLYATVVQAPVFGSKIKSFDTKPLPGVSAVVDLPPNGVGVVAESYWQAKKGAEALQMTFAESENSQQNSEKIAQLLKDGLAAKDGALVHEQGDIEKALKTAKQTVEAEYSVPYLAHVTMEPMNCTADVREDSCEVWVPTQAQGPSLQAVASLTKLPPEKITIHTTYLGGGFGRRGETDFVKQAVLLSQAVKKPVKLVWSREEDMQQDVYRPAAMAKLAGGLDENGQLQALRIRVTSPSIMNRVNPKAIKNGLDGSAVHGLDELIYTIPNQLVDYVMKNTHVPVGFWRSVGHSYTAFFKESFIDELAHAAGQDPYQFRRALLGENPRFLNVLDTLAEKANWRKNSNKNRHQGLAIHQAFGSIVGQVAEVSVSKMGDVTVHRVVCVVDCGIVINPDTVAAQMESGIIYGLSSLKEAITIKNGQVEQSNFADFPVLRIAESPIVEVYPIANEEKPGGIGEPGMPPIVPAVTNAIFAATGQRIRQLPYSLSQS